MPQKHEHVSTGKNMAERVERTPSLAAALGEREGKTLTQDAAFGGVLPGSIFQADGSPPQQPGPLLLIQDARCLRALRQQ